MPPGPSHSFLPSRRRVFLPAAAGLASAIAGIVLLQASSERTIALLATGSGCLATIWCSAFMWRREPMLWFDDAGLGSRWQGFGTVAWQDIAAVRLHRVRRRAWLAVDRTAAAQRASPREPLQQAFAKLARADDLAIPLDGLQASPEQVAAVVELALAHAKRAQ